MLTKIWGFFKDNRFEIIGGGVLFGAAELFISYSSAPELLKHLVAVIAFLFGVGLARFIQFLWADRRAYSLARIDSKLLTSAAKRGPFVYRLEKKIIARYHNEMSLWRRL